MSHFVVSGMEAQAKTPRARSRRLAVVVKVLAIALGSCIILLAFGLATRLVLNPAINAIFGTAVFVGIGSLFALASVILFQTRLHALGFATLSVYGIALVIFLCATVLPFPSGVTIMVAAFSVAATCALCAIVLGTFVNQPPAAQAFSWVAIGTLVAVAAVFIWRTLAVDPDEPSVLHAAWAAVVPIAAAVVIPLTTGQGSRHRKNPNHGGLPRGPRSPRLIAWMKVLGGLVIGCLVIVTFVVSTGLDRLPDVHAVILTASLFGYLALLVLSLVSLVGLRLRPLAIATGLIFAGMPIVAVSAVQVDGGSEAFARWGTSTIAVVGATALCVLMVGLFVNQPLLGRFFAAATVGVLVAITVMFLMPLWGVPFTVSPVAYFYLLALIPFAGACIVSIRARRQRRNQRIAAAPPHLSTAGS